MPLALALQIEPGLAAWVVSTPDQAREKSLPAIDSSLFRSLSLFFFIGVFASFSETVIDRYRDVTFFFGLRPRLLCVQFAL